MVLVLEEGRGERERWASLSTPCLTNSMRSRPEFELRKEQYGPQTPEISRTAAVFFFFECPRSSLLIFSPFFLDFDYVFRVAGEFCGPQSTGPETILVGLTKARV